MLRFRHSGFACRAVAVRRREVRGFFRVFCVAAGHYNNWRTTRLLRCFDHATNQTFAAKSEELFRPTKSR